jgi:hypothetical protein
MSVEEDHLDVLQNLEFAIVEIYKKNPDLIDAEVLTAIEALIRIYGAEAQGKTIGSRPIRGLSQSVAESVKFFCEVRLGRSTLTDSPIEPTDPSIGHLPTISLEILVACLKRIQTSINFWTKKNGRQGYLDYILRFIS